ncbi:T9SS type A sorting domain-containing protein [Cesiribacter andamanensis]|uniref:Secretion system C-terminal sorting domain-containing protein n=1 Tax=Cesiribacter andamanensis AMV16 TaxID=1279009 RepID=M7N6P2_9BACT|nr:T9SS type A sorting domain-containing protein [Cesiribacter andamanensis]EMR02952.1 hypothetical protein ADICEAN_01925 [Cesiribacter andamanensis AMV16]
MLQRATIFLILILSQGAFALAQQQELVLTGVYNGRNLYVQNPLSGNLKDYCTREVWVNGELIFQNPRSSAYTINLSHLSTKAPVEIKIRYSEGCMPKVINPQVVRELASFKYLAVHADSAHVSWTTNNQQKGGKFFLEHWINEQWTPIATLSAEEGQARYQARVNHYSGLNRYRIKFLQDDGEMYYSNVIDHSAQIAPVTFSPTRVSDKIFLSRDTDYEITDTGGKPLLKGSGNEIFVGNLASGVYYLKINNRTEKFFKK